MARPALPDDQKRKQVAVRLSPEDRKRVQASAEERGVGPGAEIERLALLQLAFLEQNDEPTRDLLSAIADEIRVIESVTGKRWHRDRSTWAAVAEMLRVGPVRLREVDRAEDDTLKSEWEELVDIIVKKEEIAQELLDFRISVTPEHPLKSCLKEIGMYDGQPITQETATSLRITEVAAIHALPEGEKRKSASRLFNRLVALDIAESEVDARLFASEKLYEDADRRGRESYFRILKERARSLRASSKTFVVEHLTGRFGR